MTQNSSDDSQPAVGEPGAPPPPEPQPPAGPPPSKDECTMAMLCHLLAIFTGFIAPLVIWLMKKDESAFVDRQGKEALNFQLTLLIGVVAGVLTACFGVGFVILAAVSVVNIVFGILSTMTVNKGQPYRYPVCIRFIK